MSTTDSKVAGLVLWAAEGLTQFLNGCIRGLKPGMFVGGAYATQAPTTDAQAVSVYGATGLLITMGGNGVGAFLVWHDRNPLPNPLRQSLREAAQSNNL